MSSQAPAIDVSGLFFHYGRQTALNGLDLRVSQSVIFALLGPNGSGKSTLFRILSTVEPCQQGEVRIHDCDLRSQPNRVRQLMGVVFQSPSLDRKLTVRENLACQGVLYGLSGAGLEKRIEETTDQLGIGSRLADRVETLSGGLQRRVELAKGMLHRPRLLLMDEPSTGLDPASRLDWWNCLRRLQSEHSVTVVLTTHLLDEADKADQIAIIDHGRTVAEGSPEALKEQLGAQVLTVQAEDDAQVVQWLTQHGLHAEASGGGVRAAGTNVAGLVAPLCEAFGERVQMVAIGRPSLEDVFIEKTGRPFFENDQTEVD